MSPNIAQFSVRLRARLARARQEGGRRIAWDVADLVVSFLFWCGLLPLTLMLHMAGFRRLSVLTGRIGHLAAEPDSFLKARILGMVRPLRYFMLAPSSNVANAAMLDYWRSHILLIEHPAACWFLGAMSRWVFMKHDMSRYVLKLGASQKIYRINAAWKGRSSLLVPSEADVAWSNERFAELGFPPEAWFVCVHVREPGFSPADEAVHAYRNGDPRAVRAAMDEIVRRGGWCVRMGDPSMTPLQFMPGVIDYAHHPLRSERLDVLLCARARFFLGNTSGLSLVSTVFGVPSALVNLIPVSARPFLATDIGIPKLLRSTGDGRILSFAEVLNSPAGDFRYAKQYADAGLEIIENAPEDILSLTIEMLDRLEGHFEETPEDGQLQQRFRQLFRPGHYSYGAASRTGTAFLRKYRALLPTSDIDP